MAAASAAAALAVGLLTAPGATATPSDDDLKDKRDRAEQRIDRASSDFAHSSRRAARAASALRAARARLLQAQERLDRAEASLAEARARDRELQEQLALAVQRLQDARRALDAARARLDGQRSDVADVISDVYEQGDPGLLAISSFLEAQDPADLTRRVEARRVIVGQETRAYDAMRAAEVLLVVEEDEIEQIRDEVARRREEAARNLEQMEVLRAEAVQSRREVVRLLRRSRQAEARASAARRADQRALAEAKADRARISELLRRRAAAARARARAARGSRVPVRSGGGFLSSPANGYVSSPYGYRTHPIYGYYSLHDGTDFAAACGSPLYAGAPGVVVSSYFQTAYGNRLVIDHGGVRGVGLASIYNHATSYTVSPGQRVSRGQVVGYVGSTGWSTGCHLHFSVLVNGRTVNPTGWL